MTTRSKPIELGRVAGLLFLPLLLVGGALSIPYAMVARRVRSRRERRFAKSMKVGGRTMEWARFIRETNEDRGTLIIERFSLKGPIRMWWTEDNAYEVCPYSLVDWFTMAHDKNFDAVRDWCHNRYTGPKGSALLVDGSKEQWRTIRGDGPLTFQERISFLEVPPPRQLSKVS